MVFLERAIPNRPRAAKAYFFTASEGLKHASVRRLTSDEYQPIMVSDCNSRIGELGTFLAERVTNLSPTR